MKFSQSLLTEAPNFKHVNMLQSPQVVSDMQKALAALPRFKQIKLLKDLEDIKKGGSEWRQKPSLLGIPLRR